MLYSTVVLCLCLRVKRVTWDCTSLRTVASNKKKAGSSVHRLHGYAMLMSPNNSEIAVHGYLCPGDMVVRPCKVMAISRSWYVCFSADIGIVE